MGAAAGKQFQHEKAKHASAVLDAIENYEKNHPGEFDDEKYPIDRHLFKRRVLLAASEVKRNGQDIDRSLSQLTDMDLDTLCEVVEKHRREQRNKNGNSNSNSSVGGNSGRELKTPSFEIPVPFEEEEEEDVVEDVEPSDNEHALGNDNIDETTSVLSYGDGDVATARDSEGEVDASGPVLIRRPSPFATHTSNPRPSRGDVDETLVETIEGDLSDDLIVSPNRLTKQALKILAPNTDNGLVEALAKFWEIEEIVESPLPTASPRSSALDSADSKSLLKRAYQNRSKLIDDRNETLMGLQRQKVMSFTQNAQLEREVEALQRQLEKMEEMDRTLVKDPSTSSIPSSTSKTMTTGSRTRNHYHSSAIIFPEQTEQHSPPPSIFPIEEEGKDWSEEMMYHGGHKPTAPRRHFRYRDHKHVPSPSTSESEGEISSSRADAKDYPSRSPRNGPLPPSMAVKDKLISPSHRPLRRHLRPRQSNSSVGGDSDDLSGSSPKAKAKAPSQKQQLSDSEKSQSSTTRTGHGGEANRSARRASPLDNRREPKSSDREDEAIRSNKDSGEVEHSVRSHNNRVQKSGALKNLNKRRYSLDGAITPTADPEPSTGETPMRHELQVLGREDYKSPSKRSNIRLRRLKKDHSVGTQEDSVVAIAFESNADQDKNTRADYQDVENDLDVSNSQVNDLSSPPSGVVEDASPAPSTQSHHAAVHPVRRKKGRAITVSAAPKAASTDSTPTSQISSTPAVWTNELDYGWAEVSLLLRKAIKTEQDMLYTVAAAEAGILFTDQMNSLAKSLNVLRGTLSRWILPYDNNTRIDSQCSTPHSVLESMPEEFRGKLSERQVHYLVSGANGVRKLVRIKIADDNDLEQARKALQTINTFFKLLYRQAELHAKHPFELLKLSGSL